MTVSENVFAEPAVFESILESCEIDQLEAANDLLLAQILQIKNQIDRANADYKSEGIPIDFKWLANARHALRMKGQQHNRLARRISKIKNRSLASYFIDVAKRDLDEQDFKEMMEEAKEMKLADDQNVFA